MSWPTLESLNRANGGDYRIQTGGQTIFSTEVRI
jgi:hypothetical protein